MKVDLKWISKPSETFPESRARPFSYVLHYSSVLGVTPIFIHNFVTVARRIKFFNTKLL